MIGLNTIDFYQAAADMRGTHKKSRKKILCHNEKPCVLINLSLELKSLESRSPLCAAGNPRFL